MFGPTPRLELARRLAKAADEASHRASIHQAYFAAYHRCCSEIGRDPAERAEAGHARLRDDLLAMPGRDPWLMAAKANMERLFRLRAWADYDDAKPIEAKHANEAVLRAGLILG
jgi:hypothetical protein